MAIHAHKHGDESNDRLLSRWKQQTQKAELIKLLRSRKHRVKKPTRRLVRLRALMREEMRAKNQKKQFYSNM